MIIKEIYDIYSPNDIDSAPKGEDEFRINVSDVGIMWIQLYEFYNWDNNKDEILYFFKRNTNKNFMLAISFCYYDNKFIIKEKEFEFDGEDLFYNDYEDETTLNKNNLELSDSSSLGDLIIKIFKYPLVIEENIFDNIVRT